MATRVRLAALLVCAGLALSIVSCYALTGSGNIVTESRTVSDFSEVSLAGAGELVLAQGGKEGLTITADDNIMPHIRTQVSNGKLTVDFDVMGGIRPSKPIKLDLTVKTIRAVHLSGGWKVQAERIKTDRLALKASGSAEVKLEGLEATDLTTEVSGSGRFSFAGQVTTQKVDISGAGNYAAGNLSSQTAKVKISGSGNATLWVREGLDVSVSGAGAVGYYGSPKITQNIAGSGTLKTLGNK